MGTPKFAVPCLKRLVADGHDISVFTQPDKPAGRKRELFPPPVKTEAERVGIAVFQPPSVKDGEALKILKEISPELIIVAAYGKILPPEIISLPPEGCVNIHASLLPKYRGAAPIQQAIIDGESETGITSMLMDEGLDTGDMLLTEAVLIGENETAGELGERLSIVGADVMSKTITALSEGSLKPKKQDESLASYAKMLTKEMSPIDWSRPAGEIHNKIRGLFPWPAATTEWKGKKIKLCASRLCAGECGVPGEVAENDGRLIVSCGNGQCLEIITLQAQGKREMPAAEFLRGGRIEKGDILR